MSIYLHKVKSRWQPGENTLAYYQINNSDTSSVTYDGSGNNNDATWVTPTAKGFKMLSPDSPLTVPYDWYGTEAEYTSATKSNDTEYRTV